MAAPVELDVDSSAFAAWLVATGEDRLWTVDGEAQLAGRIPMPCTARELADGLKKYGKAKLRLFAPGALAPDGPEIAKYAGKEEGAQVFEVAWIQDDVAGDRWMIAEDNLAEEAERAATKKS
jgi:hypothetical protein